ncbi:MAG: FAD-binding oxidoreductase [Hyphomonadaceae bacterium]|nr:FAD-binding oxidoreductase [Hyphomonadaceae bacterium]
MNVGQDERVYLIIGGGFYGCCLALQLQSASKKVILIEEQDEILNRASRINQARIHTGFHYPRSALTAVKSLMLCKRFAQDFSDAVIDDFQMLYAIPKRRSRVSAKRFYLMFRDLGAPIRPAAPDYADMFDTDMIDQVFECHEPAFDYTILRSLLKDRLEAAGIDVRLNTRVDRLKTYNDRVVAHLSDGSDHLADYAFNVTYSNINRILTDAKLSPAKIKHEWTEIVLLDPPSELRGIGVTVMDGPFFSCMPFPSENAYSLTHVRYTPHMSWTDDIPGQRPEKVYQNSNMRHMINDSSRYLPCLRKSRYLKSLYETKTVLIKNEQDDGRPILYQRSPPDSRVISVLGGKLDNIYDLFDLVRHTDDIFGDNRLPNIIGATP